MKQYRDNGAIGALLDEYERAIHELQDLIADISPHELTEIVDHETKDPDCRSIQTILRHVVRAGYGYISVIRKSLGEKVKPIVHTDLSSIKAFQTALTDMFHYSEQLFEDYPNIVLEENDNQKKILVSWGQLYDVEQLIEHAIVHILRHRRQIERFLIKLSGNAE